MLSQEQLGCAKMNIAKELKQRKRTVVKIQVNFIALSIMKLLGYALHKASSDDENDDIGSTSASQLSFVNTSPLSTHQQMAPIHHRNRSSLDESS